MTDLTPNVEVILTSDLFDDDPCFESMSASALAILDAYLVGFGWLDGPTKKDCLGVAAVLRAAAQLIAEDEMEQYAPDILRDIAAELENN